MKLFSNCNDCHLCAFSDGCIAGIGDDDFQLASKEDLIERYQSDDYANDPVKRLSIANALKIHYNVTVEYTKNESCQIDSNQ